MLPISESEREIVWNIARPHKDFRLRASAIPFLPMFIKAVVGKWTCKVGPAVEWVFGPDPKV